MLKGEGFSVKGVMKLLAAAKLVTLSEEESAQAQSEPIEIPTMAVDPVVNVAPVVPRLEGGDVVEGRAFEEIFASANLPPSPFPAERLLRLLDGLRAMDEATRKAAVMAMDAADENWTIADPIIDAQRKSAVLESYREGLTAQVASTEQTTAAKIAELTSDQERAVAEIRKQILELEKLLEREVQKKTEQIAALDASLKATRDAVDREGRRITAEIDRLREIPAQFAQPTTPQ